MSSHFPPSFMGRIEKRMQLKCFGVRVSFGETLSDQILFQALKFVCLFISFQSCFVCFFVFFALLQIFNFKIEITWRFDGSQSWPVEIYLMEACEQHRYRVSKYGVKRPVRAGLG